MYEQIQRHKESKSRAVVNSVFQRKGEVKQGFDFVDNRPKIILQRKLQEAIGNSIQSSEIAQPLQLLTTDGSEMAGVVVPNGSQQGQIETLLGKITDVGSLMRSARTLDTEGDVRLDMQGMTSSGYYNLQIQIGSKTVATVLLHPGVGNDQLTEVLKAFTDSRTSGLTKIVDPDEKEKVEKPQGYYDDYQNLSRWDKKMIDRALKQGQYPPRG